MGGEQRERRILGLDALRFLCALCVVQGHLRLGGRLGIDRLDGSIPLQNYVKIIFNQGIPIPTGPNAVIVFFVISGFCIHYPYRNGRRIEVRQFLARRYIRIGIPALCATVPLYAAGFHQLQDSVLWSIICEGIYYSLYPLLIMLRDRIGWALLLGGAFAAAVALIVLRSGDPYNGNFTTFGAGLTWVLGLPCWLLGCLLAERHSRTRAAGWYAQWIFRIAIIAAACLGTTLRFYAGVGYYWSQPLLAILIYFWLSTEMAYYAVRRPARWLEWCGNWSYSIYLFHAPISIYAGRMIGSLLSVNMAIQALLELSAALVGSYVLYHLIERPAQVLARRYHVPGRAVRVTAP